jgi:hypothetical protein
LNKDVSASGTITLTAAESANIIHRYFGTITSNTTVVVPATVALLYCYNNTAGAFTVTVKTSAGTGVTVAQGGRTILYCDGTNVVDADDTIPSGSLLFSAGSAAAPSVTFVGNITDGMYLPAAGRVGISTSGVQRVEFNSGGLDVNGANYLSYVVGLS